MLPIGGQLGCGSGCNDGGCDIITNNQHQCGDVLDPNIGGMQAAQDLHMAENKYLPRGISRVKLLGKNTIVIQDVNQVVDGWFKVIIGHDEELTDIQPRSYFQFSELCVLAVRSYMYTMLRITAAEAELKNGFKLEAFSDTIQEYSESEADYQENLRKWGAVAFNNDPKRVSTLLALQLNPYMF